MSKKRAAAEGNAAVHNPIVGYSDPYTGRAQGDEWVIDAVSEVYEWIWNLDDRKHARVVGALEALASQGPGLGRPLVDTLRGSSIANLKELRWIRPDPLRI